MSASLNEIHQHASDPQLEYGLFAITNMFSPDRDWLIQNKKIAMAIHTALANDTKKNESPELIANVCNKMTELDEELALYTISIMFDKNFSTLRDAKIKEIVDRKQVIIDSFISNRFITNLT